MDHSFDQFMPHGHCFLWRADILALHVISDALIAIAYFTIPLAIFYFIRHKRVRNRLVPVLFISFIMTCGITHVFSIWNFWNADYWIAGGFKALCAGISVTTAALLWFLMPAALKHPTVKDVEDLNEQLQEANQELEARVRQRTRQLESLNMELGHINSIISHDFKNSLNVLLGYASLTESCKDLEECRTYGQSIHRVSLQLNQLISDMAGLVKLGQEHLEIKEIDLNQMIRALLAEFRIQLEEVEAQVEVDPLPTIYGVESLMHQLFANLMSNSIKYRSSQRKLKIRVFAKIDAEDFEVYWEDNGEGVSVEDQERIFEMYKRGRNAEQLGEGSGIGLAFCRKICRIHGGEIELTSKQPPQGAGFVIVIPRSIDIPPKDPFKLATQI